MSIIPLPGVLMKEKVQKERTLGVQRFLQGEDQERQRKRAPKEKSESPWSLHIGSFWKPLS